MAKLKNLQANGRWYNLNYYEKNWSIENPPKRITHFRSPSYLSRLGFCAMSHRLIFPLALAPLATLMACMFLTFPCKAEEPTPDPNN